MNVLALNAGSSSLKYRLLRVSAGVEEVLSEGTSENADGETLAATAGKVLEKCLPLGIDAVAHRVVHGGAQFTAPTLVTSEVLSALHTLKDLDPLHNPDEVALIEQAQSLLPGVPQVVVFDTAFHRTLPEVAWRYALPLPLCDRLGLRRYGFHGISHQHVSERLRDCLGLNPAGTRLITCHLGSGASVCAIRDGKSLDTSMGLTPLEGLVMGTRSGDVDPGLLLYLLRTQNLTPEQLDDLLNHQSGLRGLSGRSGDVRELEKAAEAGDAASALALDVFAYRVSKYIGAYAAVLEGVDAVAFTGGIGEHSPMMRSRICRRLAFLGIVLSTERNENVGGGDAREISADAAKVAVWVIPTDEERQMAREAAALLK